MIDKAQKGEGEWGSRVLGGGVLEKTKKRFESGKRGKNGKEVPNFYGFAEECARLEHELVISAKRQKEAVGRKNVIHYSL